MVHMDPADVQVLDPRVPVAGPTLLARVDPQGHPARGPVREDEADEEPQRRRAAGRDDRGLVPVAHRRDPFLRASQGSSHR